LDLGPVQMASAWGFTTYHRRWSFPVHRIHRKVTLERYRSVAGYMRPYEGVRVWIFSSFLLFSCTGMAAQGSAAREGDDVMAAGQDRVTARDIVTSRECNCTPAIILPYNDMTSSPILVCNRIYPYSGVRSHTGPYPSLHSQSQGNFDY
jgi:hypothetical protein